MQFFCMCLQVFILVHMCLRQDISALVQANQNKECFS